MDTARLWVLRVNEADFSGWDAFTQWLEEDPGHLALYEAALAEDAFARDIAAAMPAVLPFTPRKPSVWRYAVPGAMAASLTGVVLWFGVLSGAGITEITTGPGEMRDITLADGTQIALNGNSRITYDADEPRMVTLAAGEALFEVEHDDANPFVVMVGQTRLVDAGTIFNVTSDGGAIEVGVAEGAVIYYAAGTEITLNPGDRLTRTAANAPAQVVRADTAAMGSWRDGLLQYDNAPLSDVARDLSRALGKPVRAVGGAQQMRYTGTLSATGSQQALLAATRALLGVTITETSDHWEMTPANAPSP